MKHVLFLALVFTCLASNAQTPTIEAKKDGLSNESELGIVDSSGNSRAASFDAKQQDAYRFDDKNTAKLLYRYLDAESKGVESAHQWDAAGRFERQLSSIWGAFVNQGAQYDVFAGIHRRYNTDVGAKYSIVKKDRVDWDAEAGYRYTLEYHVDGTKLFSSFIRLYTEANWKLGDSSSTRFWFEYLPNLSHPQDYQLNSAASVQAALNSFLSLKLEYLLKYNNRPPAPATERLDRIFTTNLVAKF